MKCASAMRDFLKAIATSRDLETVFVNRRSAGISISMKKRVPLPRK